ncbi:hypothetical protein PIB30_001178 [Stylosanthes scabra]|uniref:Uncharacterized protein n=1 Tax=Stylosanthes scabra TaxID=79078 RepID=A0ABU6V0Z3_9FABA|nr:hypothetical protein [Stylosanthes scabra]
MDQATKIDCGLGKELVHLAYNLEVIEPLSETQSGLNLIASPICNGPLSDEVDSFGDKVEVVEESTDLRRKAILEALANDGLGVEHSESDQSCLFPPGFGLCIGGHVHKDIVNEGCGFVNVGSNQEQNSGVHMTDTNESEEISPPFFSLVKEARSVIRVCEDGGICFKDNEKVLIEQKLVDIEEKTVSKYDLRPRQRSKVESGSQATKKKGDLTRTTSGVPTSPK